MIVRHFVAKATRENAAKYYTFFRDTLAPQLKAIPGHRGALVLSNEGSEAVDVTVLTFWESDEAIHRFAGDDPSLSVVEPEARGMLSWFAEHVTRMVVEVEILDRR